MTNFEQQIQRQGYIVCTNEGDSMLPLLRQHKDIMVIRKITDPLHKNDVVLFQRPNGAYVLHRIIRVCGSGQYRIAGDNRSFSEIVPEEWIIGILSEVVRDGRHISVESDEYREYVKKVPLHRIILTLQRYPQAIIRKIKNGLRRINE